MNSQFKKGIIELCVLSLISKKDMYGYQLVKEISLDISISINTIYPILKRLTIEGYFEAYINNDSNQEKKYYHMTKKGHKYYEENISSWNEFIVNVDKILERGEKYE